MSAWTDFKKSAYGVVVLGTLRIVDRLLCGIVYRDWKHTVSAHLGASNPNCLLCRLLNKLEQDHCLKAAKDEGLIP